MSRFDFSGLAQSAIDLVTLFGAPGVAVIPGVSQLAGSEPWRGKDCGGSKDVTIEIAITDWLESEIDGTLIRRGDKQGWTFPPATGEDLSLAGSVVQNNTTYSVEDILIINPASEVLAYRFNLRR